LARDSAAAAAVPVRIMPQADQERAIIEGWGARTDDPA
jgi:hypothetical protein|tara:strand:+ start:16 stop:129 length:114 start_codon:yes stop_codon:yes gene_type:complete